MKKQLILITILTIYSSFLYAQVTISGKVKDNHHKAMPGASITLKDTYDGATSDSLGNFKFQTTEKGAHTIEITALGYKPYDQAVNLDNPAPVTVDIELKEQLDELRAVTVTAGTFAAGDNKRGTVLSSIDVATTAGSNADISAALRTLPGTQQIGEQEGLFVRGGAGYETKQYIDGTLVNNPYFSSVPDIASRGRFSPFLFKGTVFSTGGYSAEYGQALSSVVLLESIDLPERSEIDASVSPLVVGAGTQQLSSDKKSSFGFSYDYVNVGLYFSLVKQTPDYFILPIFHNGDANYRHKTKNGMIKYYTTFAYSDLGLRRQDVDSLNLKDAFSLKNINWYNNLSWKENLGNGWKMNLGASYSTNTDNIIQQVQNQQNKPETFAPQDYWMTYKDFTIDSREDLTQAKLVFEKKLWGISSIRFGSEYWYNYNKYTYDDTLHKLIDNYTATFVEARIYLTNELAAQIGGRFEYSSVINKADVAPRISLAYKVSKDAQFSLAYGEFYQKPENDQLIYQTNVGFTKATHYIVNYQKMNNDRIFRVEAYYKTYQDLIKTVPIGYNYYSYNNSGYGYARGVDVFFRDKKTIKNFDYWISYSYVDTKRNYLNFTEEMQPNFAATNTASLVMKRFFTKIKSGVNLTYTWASGRPYYNFINDNGKSVLTDNGFTKDYNSLNFSAEYVPSAGKTNARTNVVLFASITNLLGYNSVYGYNYPFSGVASLRQPIEPPAKRFYFIGCFLSWGVDRTQDAINNNL